MRSVRADRHVLLFLTAATLAGCGSDGGTGPGPVPSYVQLQSDPGDYIGAGSRYSYTQANSVIAVTASGGFLSVSVQGDQQWSGEFQAPGAQTQLQPGSYTELRRYPFHDAAVGGLSWSGEGRGCNTLTGRFTIDHVTYANGVLTAIDLSFEQHCEGGPAALRGVIHWRIDDATRPPGPVNPIPAGLWRPAAGATPASGNYLYLASEPGDYIGAGQTFLYTAANEVIGAALTGGRISASAAGWSGDFQPMSSLSRPEVGYYPDLRRFPFHNPMKGGLSWSGQGRGCNTVTGWFVVDLVTYGTSGNLTALDLRFEQHCEGQAPALHGAIRWRL